ncbi:PAS domain S-box protein [Maridesulfovibrio sp.]|uniref:PAS domain S-box protein n=1 Tax=Maridesulfovibrio sp. TaxID=2795000 RepID=UPI002A18DAA2|nr:PAS domain S-box protein [Maridesulfovibrio sp.]
MKIRFDRFLRVGSAGAFLSSVFQITRPVTAAADGFAGMEWPDSVSDTTIYVLLGLALLLAFMALYSFRRPAGLRQRLLSTFLFVSLLPICVLAILDQKVTSDALSANSRQVMMAAALHTADELDSFLLSNLSTVRTESTIPQFAEFLRIPPEKRDDSPEEMAVAGLLTALKRRDQTNITSIALLDMSGNAVADTYGPDFGTDKSDRSYFVQPIMTGLPYVSTVGLSGISSQPSLYFSCPVRDTSGEILGVLRFRYNAAVLQKILVPRGGEEDSVYGAILFGGGGMRMADTKHPELVLTPAYDALAAGADAVAGKSTAVGPGIERDDFFNPELSFFYSSLYGPEQDPTLNVKVRLRYAPWTLVLGYSEAANQVKIATQSRYALLAVVCIIIGVTATAVLVSRSITKPLLSLTEAVRRLSHGEEEVSVSVQSGDEIGELAAKFNKMSKALHVSRQKVEASSERLQTLLDALPDCVFIHDADGHILDVNKSFERMFGYSAQEAVNLFIEDLSGVGYSQKDAVDQVYGCVSEGFMSFDWVSRRKDGYEFPVHVQLRRFRLPEGMHVMALASDITERKQFEQDLMHARNYIAGIIDSMPSILISVDVNGLVTQWNIQAEQAIGIAKSEARGKRFAELIPYLSDEMEKINDAIRNRTPVSDMRRVHMVGGVARYEDIAVFPLYADGMPGAVIRIDDVTERVRLEQVMVQSEKMLSVGGLAAGMAHEINNPLAAIMGSVQNMRKRLLDDMKKNRETARLCGIDLDSMRHYMVERDIPKMIDSIHDAGTRAARIVSNILRFSRKSGEGFEQNDLAALLDNALELIASDYDLNKDYDFKNISLLKKYAPDIPPVFCEGNQIQQVFLNLLKNAAEAVSEKRENSPLPQIIVSTGIESGMAVVEVEDNGPGMDADACRRVFEPFYTTKSPGKGTGLGLSVSYFIITDQHDGTMEVFSDPGHCTKFVVRLPLGNGSRRAHGVASV